MLIDPLSIGIGLIGWGALTGAKIVWDIARRRLDEEDEDDPTEQVDPPEPETEEEKAAREAEEERRRLEEAERKRRLEEERKRREAEEQAKFEAEQRKLWEMMKQNDYRLREVVDTLTQNIQFTGRRILVGHRQTGDKFIGLLSEEVPHPADSIVIRPIKGFHERHMLLPSELAYTPMILNARISSGEALVAAHVKQTPMMEDVFEPVYETEIKILYVLVDVSPSMWHKDDGGVEWRIPLMRGITMRLIEKALASKAPCVLREFSDSVRERVVLMNPAQARSYRNRLWNMPPGDGTDISDAVFHAVRDLSGQQYKNADIMLVTDGEDSNLNPSRIRAVLDEANIKLHAIMLGVENNNLRECCDRYQIVASDLTVQPMQSR